MWKFCKIIDSACDYGCCFFVLAPFGLTGGIHLKLLCLRWPREQPIFVLYIFLTHKPRKKASFSYQPSLFFFSRVGTPKYKCVYHLSIPGTVMTSIIEGQSPKYKAFSNQNKGQESIWIPRYLYLNFIEYNIYIYLC